MMNSQTVLQNPEPSLDLEKHKRLEAERVYIESEQYLMDLVDEHGGTHFERQMNNERVDVRLHFKKKKTFHLPHELDDNHILLDETAKKSFYQSPVHIMLGAEHRDKTKSFYSAQTVATAIAWCLNEKRRLGKAPKNNEKQPGKIIVSLHAAMKFLFNNESPDAYYSEEDQIKRIQ
jgi:hypothetical protein